MPLNEWAVLSAAADLLAEANREEGADGEYLRALKEMTCTLLGFRVEDEVIVQSFIVALSETRSHHREDHNHAHR